MTKLNLTPMLSIKRYSQVDHTQGLNAYFWYGAGQPQVIKAAPPKQSWVWDSASKRYRESESGRYIGAAKMVEYRDTFTDRQIERTDMLVDSLVKGDITIQQWELAMREAIKETYLAQYSAAKGGRQGMTKRDYGINGAALKQQYNKYLRPFTQEIKDGKYTGQDLDSIAARLKVRSGMYIDSSTKMYERGRSEALGVPKLPHYPGDGSTECITRCRCTLVWSERLNGWVVKWVRDKESETCETCKRRDKAPALIIKGGIIQNPKVWD